MQNLIYDQAPYDILYYDSNLDVYRNDRFAGWQNKPADGTPFFTYDTLGYTQLTDAKAQPSATPVASAAEAPSSAPGASAAATAAPDSGSSTSSSSSTLPLLIVAVVAVLIVAGGLLWNRRRGATTTEDE